MLCCDPAAWNACACGSCVQVLVEALEVWPDSNKVAHACLQCLVALCKDNAMMKANVTVAALKPVIRVLQEGGARYAIAERGFTLLAVLQVRPRSPPAWMYHVASCLLRLCCRPVACGGSGIERLSHTPGWLAGGACALHRQRDGGFSVRAQQCLQARRPGRLDPPRSRPRWNTAALACGLPVRRMVGPSALHACTVQNGFRTPP